MNTEVTSGRVRHNKNKLPGGIPITAFMAGLALLSSGVSHAADGAAANAGAAGDALAPAIPTGDGSVAELQAEVARLKKALEKSQKDLAEQQGKQPAAENAPATVTASEAPPKSEPEQADAEANQPAQLNQITVQAPNRLKAVKDVPQSISLVSGDQLAAQDAEDLPAITKRLSNVATFSTGNSREYSISIRGLGYESNTESQDPSVLVTVDDVPYAYNPLASFDLVDLDTVAVAHGPQGTQGGKNADVGGIYINTKRPSFTPEASYQVAYGGYTGASIGNQGDLGSWDRVIGNAVFGGPVINDLLAWRGTLSVDRGNGYIGNIYNTSQSYGNTDREQGRLQFLLTPTENLSARIKLDFKTSGAEYSNGMTIYTPTPAKYADGGTNTLSTDASTRLARSWFSNPYPNYYSQNYLYGGGLNAVDNNSQQPLITRSHGATANVNYNLGDYTLSSITSFQQYYFLASNDEGTRFDITTASGGGVDYHQFTQEFRLNSPVGGFLDYQTGVFLMSNSTQGAVNVSKNGWGADAGAWFASADSNGKPGQYSILDGTSDGQRLLSDSLNNLRKAGYEDTEKRQGAFYAQAHLHFTPAFSVTEGLRLTYEERRTWDNALITDQGNGAILNPTIPVNGVQLPGGGTTAQIQQQYAGATTAQIAAAQALRQAQIGVLWNNLTAQPFYKIQPTWLLSPSYKFNEGLTGYGSWQHGEKAGVALNINGVSQPALPEVSTAYELGLKSLLLNKTLTLNGDIFYNNFKNYQQAVQVLDPYTTALNVAAGVTPSTAYVSTTGNAAKVHVKGLEVDGLYTPNAYVSLHFSGAYNDAIFYNFANMGQPVENADLAKLHPYRDVSGKRLPGAARYSFSLGADLRYPLHFVDNGADEAFLTFNTAYTSRYNSDNTALSSYAWIHAHAITDLSVGAGRIDKRFDISLLVKNLFNNTSPIAQTWDSYTPAPPRWIGLQVSGKL
ncbi:MAG: TonB-dependent receptor [Nevskia sp.]|nr:TonB-dependent receptor [Nevskia sp.]